VSEPDYDPRAFIERGLVVLPDGAANHPPAVSFVTALEKSLASLSKKAAEAKMSNVITFVARGFGYLVVGAVLLGILAALLGALAAIVAAYVIS